jgi:hypothetical protein
MQNTPYLSSRFWNILHIHEYIVGSARSKLQLLNGKSAAAATAQTSADPTSSTFDMNRPTRSVAVTQ